LVGADDDDDDDDDEEEDSLPLIMALFRGEAIGEFGGAVGGGGARFAILIE
jgi:hypothetical protein